MKKSRWLKRRGVTLVEVLIAGSIFAVGLLGIAGLIVYSAGLRGVATKRASMMRLANRSFQELAQLGYDGLPASDTTTGPSTVSLEDGRVAELTSNVVVATGAPLADGGIPCAGAFGATLPTNQACCAGGLCCKELSVQVRIQDQQGNWSGQETLNGFITKSCP